MVRKPREKSSLAHAFVPAEGPTSAEIVIVGESPWTSEAELRRPFVGASGNLLSRMLREVGIERGACCVDNVYPFMPPGKGDGTLPAMGDRLKYVRADVLVSWMRNLHQRIAALPRVKVVAALGNYAVFALLGKGKVEARIAKEMASGVVVSDVEKKAGITKLRGSVYDYVDLNGRVVKVVPVIHPAALMESVKWGPRTLRDWRRVKEIAEGRWRAEQEPVVVIEPGVEDLRRVIEGCERVPWLPVAVDIETWGKTLSCFGFAPGRGVAYVLPTANKGDREYWMPWIRRVCGLANPKILQNGLFDCYWLRMGYGVEVRNFTQDTMCVHHALDAVEEHSLEFLTSIYTGLPYYKDEAKDAEEIVKFAHDQEALHHYNGMDCVATYRVWERLRGELRAEGMEGFYLRHYAEMFGPLLDTMCWGIRVDRAECKRLAKGMLEECERLREELKAAAGEELYAVEREGKWREPSAVERKALVEGSDWSEGLGGWPPKAKYVNREAAKRLGYVMSRGEIQYWVEKPKKDFSPIALKRFFHEKLGVPEQRKRKTQKVTVDEVALRRMVLRWPQKVGEWPLKVVRHRELKKEYEIVKGGWDKDGRIRCAYKLTTEAGRLASSTNPMGKGRNLQNVKRGERRVVFKADEGCVMVRLDLSQVEDRVGKMYTGAKRLVKLANMRPEDYDVHVENARIIFGKEEISKEERYLGKRVVHASWRGMRGAKLSDELLKDETVIGAKKCDELLERYHEAYPEIRERYFALVRKEVFARKGLVSTWGRRISFEREIWMGRMDEDMWRRAYSFWPQAEAADLLDEWGFKVAAAWMAARGSAANLQVHDEVVASLPPGEAWEYVGVVVRSLERKRMILGEWLSVPVGVTLARDWGSGVEFKGELRKGEFEEVAWGLARGEGA